MKNIIIIGRPRAGKSTLADIISEKYHYQIIRTDCLRIAFKDVFPELNIGPGTAIYDERFQAFIKRLFQSNLYHSRNKEGFIIEGCEMTVQTCKEFYENENNLIYALGRCENTIDEMVEAMIKYDTEFDWSYNMAKEELYNYCEKQINKSKLLKEECNNLNIKYYDTSFKREDVFNNILIDIEKNMEK